MRRTYKSKKDTTGVLDYKDVLLTLDEKSSTFDAFYIQNIKQTKREMSCMGASSNYVGPNKKVKNKKYVKRIVKVDPVVRESLSKSVYMTPDKSIRVNKAPDLFDQLLNSSNASQEYSPCSSKTALFAKLRSNRECKKYTKKTIITKKFNYSSTESDSEKENSVSMSNNITKNTSNINIHKLLIEKQDQPTSKNIDQSICNILEKLPELNKMVNQRKSKCRVSFKPHRHRLTKTSSLLDNSLLSSTPFKEKYRSNSIYNFSPISSEKLENSLNYVTLTNNSLQALDNTSEKLQNERSPGVDYIQSPILQSSKSIKSRNCHKHTSKSFSKIENLPLSSRGLPKNDTIETSESRPFLGFAGHLSNDKPNSYEHEDIPEIDKFETTESRPLLEFTSQLSNEQDLNYEDCKSLSGEKQVLDESHVEVDKENINFSELHTTEAELFIGFDNPSPARISRQNKICIDDSCLLSGSDDSIQQITIQDQNNISDIEDIDTIRVKISSIVNEIPENISMDSINTREASDIFETSQIDDTVNEYKIGNLNNVSANDYKDLDMIEDSKNCNNDNHGDSKSVSLLDISDNDYDTCNSEQSESDEDTSETRSTIKYPKVEIVRLRHSILEKYMKSDNIDISSTSHVQYIQDESVSENFNMSTIEQQNAGNLNESISESADEVTKFETKNIEDNIIISSSEGDCVDSNSNDEDRCVSFVTTRRRNDVLIDTSIFALDDTVCSPAKSDCDKTVISLKTEMTDSQELNITRIEQKTDSQELNITNKLDDKVLQEWNALQMERKTACKKKTDLRSSEYPRQSSRSSRQSISHDETLKSDIKEAIVLQPGKKWERSLSIYKRMTQIADHFDESIIDNDQHKGRNYRQSVINTMESQEVGSVHNVSISSRRSTILSKPRRSTVRLINETSSSRLSTTTVFEDLQGFLHEDCDDTVIELSKLSIAESEREISLENLDDYERGVHETRGTTARDYVLRRCNQRDVILFDECYPETDLKNCHKIGEGVYGEVYLWRARDGRARVMKIIPIAGDIKVNGESQKDFQEIIAEIVIAMELSALRTPLSDIERCLDEGRDVESLDLLSVENATDVFNEVIGVRCVYGPYPSRLLDLWELYDEVKGSENDNPAVLPPNQQYIVLELANAGQDLESYQFNSAEQAHALFWQVAFGLAVGEEAFEFEHRDLHWGNVLISTTEEKLVTFVIRGRVFRLRRCGVSASIIDYSLSRISLQLGAGADCTSAALYNDLANDHDLFSAVGDYQFDVYRLMRDKLGNDWKTFEPSNNILWLHYTVDKMITALRYKRTNTKIHKHYIAKLKGIKNRILQYGSASEFVLTDNEI